MMNGKYVFPIIRATIRAESIQGQPTQCTVGDYNTKYLKYRDESLALEIPASSCQIFR